MKIEVTVKKIIYQTQHGYVVFSGELVGQTQEIICVGQTSKLQKDMIVKCEGEYI
jgi:hypothetical protein